MILKNINNRFSKVPITIRLGVVLSLCLIFLSSGYLYWKDNQNKAYKPQKPDIVQNVQGVSISTEDLIFAPGQIVTYEVEPNEIREKTYFRLQYLKPPQPAISRFYIEMDDDEGNYYVMQHSIFDNLDWPHVSNETYSLYQKENKYASVEDFLNDLPSDARILYDKSVRDEEVLNLENSSELVDDVNQTSITDHDFLLTTFHPPAEKDGFYIFEKTIDTTNATLSDDGKMRVLIYNQNISEVNPLYFNEIFVDFKQPAQIIYETQ